LAELPQQTQGKKEEEEKLKQRIEELQRENKYLREITATQGQQLQQQEEETFTALGQLQLRNFLVPIKDTAYRSFYTITSPRLISSIVIVNKLSKLVGYSVLSINVKHIQTNR
jgi:cell division septum initiation protein DivIVA